MPSSTLSENEKNILKVLKNELDQAQSLPSLAETQTVLDRRIDESKALLQLLNIETGTLAPAKKAQPQPIVIRTFEELLAEATEKYPNDISFEDIFTAEEIDANRRYIEQLNEEFNNIHRLDKIDVVIPAVAGILSGAVDCFLGGFVKGADDRNIPGTLSEYVGKLFDKALPPEKIKELEKLAKVTYDAANNSNTTIDVDGLSSWFHRHVSLGHDPILGFIFGVLDMLRGTMTTLDYKGKFVIQIMDNYSDRKAQNLFEAISKVFLHMCSDVNTPMGLPVPFMALFNKLQFGKIGDHDTISELVKSMYAQGYDFRHFCSMSVPVMITEVIVRVSYFAKRLSEGCSVQEAVPVGLNHEKKPKLATMLLISHSAAAAINAGKVAFTKNPLNINYPQWLSFAKYTVKQLKWSLYEKPQLRDKYVMDIINGEWDILCNEIDSLWRNTSPSPLTQEQEELLLNSIQKGDKLEAKIKFMNNMLELGNHSNDDELKTAMIEWDVMKNG